ncbi:Octamer-binding transcription factor [Parasponia andersonii]|uniref:Octamer-binding transcription factor n=1 Tax=Parasponia andersonii TaxID=3476 RepID=A0A2P5D6P2_PARAD|nr:Octamer-binding transcription factor [Parasponia andersonii]
MVQKRPYDEEETFKISFKHPRQAEECKQLVSFSESVFPEDESKISRTLDNGFTHADIKGDEKFSGVMFTDLPKDGEDIETSAPASISSWPTSGTSEEDSLSEAPFHMSFLPEYFNPERTISTLAHCEDIYSLLLNHPSSRKSVPVGPDHQVEVPPWGQQGTGSISSSSYSSEVLKSELEDEKRLMGTCVIPMPDLTSSAYTDSIIGSGRTDCKCEDKGSFSCVRKHIMEAREELVKDIGPERFLELGFCDMGEQVAQTWSEEEEHAFHQVVFSNPASLGKNFWNKLSAVFPSRTKKEIVSYYFNVFMLRKRCEQNRYDPTNIDSDNDEWQGSDDFGDNEIGMTEDNDESVVESPVHGDDTGNAQRQNDNLLQCDEDFADDICDGNMNSDSNNGEIDRIAEIWPEKLDNCGSGPASNEKGDQEVQDGSSTSSNTGVAPLRNHIESENGNRCSRDFGDDGFVLEHCDSKDWDLGYMTCSKKKVDFLPTCNMIEEVFGEETQNHKVRDGKSLNF